MKKIIEKIAAGAAAEAGAEAARRGLEKLDPTETREEREKREVKAKRKKALLILGGGAVGLVVVGALMTKVLTWLLLVGFAGAVGYGGWLLARPRLKGLFAARAEAKAARKALAASEQAAEEQVEATRRAAAAQVAKERALEDELAALKARADKDT